VRRRLGALHAVLGPVDHERTGHARRRRSGGRGSLLTVSTTVRPGRTPRRPAGPAAPGCTDRRVSMTARYSGTSTRPRLTTQRRADDEYTLSPQTVYRLVGGLAALGVLLIAVAVFASGNPKATLTGHLTHRGRPVIWGSVILYAPDGTATA